MYTQKVYRIGGEGGAYPSDPISPPTMCSCIPRTPALSYMYVNQEKENMIHDFQTKAKSLFLLGTIESILTISTYLVL